jgi:hypothetical protein
VPNVKRLQNREGVRRYEVSNCKSRERAVRAVAQMYRYDKHCWAYYTVEVDSGFRVDVVKNKNPLPDTLL